MKTLKDKMMNIEEVERYCIAENLFLEKDLKQAIKDLKVERPMHYSMNEWIDKIFGVWEEEEVMGE